MNRPILVCVMILGASAALSAQQASQTSPYSGTSNPPPDSTIIDNTPPAAKPPAAHYAQPTAPAQAPVAAQPAGLAQSVPGTQAEQQPNSGVPAGDDGVNGTDDGIVQVAPATPSQPALDQRANMNDPDGDIVHPGPLPPGELGEGTMIRVRLLDGLSTTYSQAGDAFRTRVASDVLEGGQVLIPAGAEIDGKVVRVSTGHAGGHGSMLLRPETVVLPDGSRYRLYAQTTGAPGSRTRVGSEGDITPDSRLKKDGIEYGGAVGAGAATGAIVGGPVGALAGGLIGAGAVTVHLLVDHPQATLESGTALLFTLTEPLNLVAAAPAGN